MVNNYGLKDIKAAESNVVLKEVKLSGNVCGEFVELSMKQVFENKGDNDIEAVYIFPIPDTAVITGFEATLGGRTLTAKVEDKKAASKIYEDAVQSNGNTFSLEEVEDNVFKINIGKILSSETVKIKVTYIDQLIYENDNLKLVVPAITAPTLMQDELALDKENESGYKLRLNLLVEPLDPITIESPTHNIDVEWGEENLAKVTFTKYSESLDKDFVLVFKEEERKEASGMIYEYKENNESKGILYLRLIPDLENDEEEKPRDYDFIIDISDSMEGEKLEEAKNALQLCIRNLSEGDTFNIIAAENELHYFSKDEKVPFNEESLRKASEWIENLQALDDAEILDALKYCLSEKSETGSSIILVFTDDEGEKDDEILEYVSKNIGNNRIFPFGIDTSASCYLINKLAEVGYGRPEFIYQGERIDDMVIRQFNRIESPQVDITEIDWGKMKVETTYPRTIDYMYDDEPFSIFAKVEGEIQGWISIKGKVKDKDYTEVINLDTLNLEENVNLIQKVWARKRIESMEEKLKGERGVAAETLRERVIDLSKESGIISTETSFVMIEQIEEPLLGMPITNLIPLKISESAMKNIAEAYFIESPSFIYKAVNKGNVIQKAAVKEDHLELKYSRENILRILAKNQSADGSFNNFGNIDLESKLETTVVALLAFTRGKEDITSYINQLTKSIKFIFKSIDEGDKILNKKLSALTVIALESLIVKGIAKGNLKQQIEGKIKNLSYDNLAASKNMVIYMLNLPHDIKYIEGNIKEEKNSIYELAKLAILKNLI